jgi:hypothetical protein
LNFYFAEEVEATIILSDTGAKKKLSSDGTALNMNVEASATITNGYQPGNLVSYKMKLVRTY